MLFQRIYILLLLCLLTLSCWKKQEHEIVAPPIPVYTLSGRVVHSYTGEVIRNAQVSLMGAVKYNNEDSTSNFSAQVETDEQGGFSISDVPGGYLYALQISKDSFLPYRKNINVYYDDRNLGDCKLGKLLVLQKRVTMPELHITGVAVDNQFCWITDTLKNEMLKLDESLHLLDRFKFEHVVPQGLSFDSDTFYTYNVKTDSFYVFRLIEPDSIDGVLAIPAPINPYHPESVLRLSDFDIREQIVWGYAEPYISRYIRYDPNAADPPIFYDNPVYAGSVFGIAVDKSILYIGVAASSENRLYEYNLITEMYKGYRIIPDIRGRIAVANDQVYVVSTNMITLFIYD